MAEKPERLKLRIEQLEEQREAQRVAHKELRAELKRESATRKHTESTLRKYRQHVEELAQERLAELRESELRYQGLFNQVPAGLYRTTPAGEILDVNPQFVEMLGYRRREDVLALHAGSTYADPEERRHWQTLLEKEGVVRGFETRLRTRTGAVIWVNNTARAVRDEQGRVLHYEGSIEDITPRKRVEAELHEYQEHLEELVKERTAELQASQEGYRSLFDGVPVGLYRTTPEGKILDQNLAAVQMLGFDSREEALASKTPRLYVDPADRLRWKDLMEREDVVRDFEVQFRRRDGTPVWVNDTARTVRDEQGRVLYYDGSLEDITDRKRFEEELRRQKDYFEALFLNTPVAVVTADTQARVVTWNPMAEKLFGYSQEEAVGKPIDHLVANDPSLRAEAAVYSQQASHVGRVEVTTRRTRRDGSLIDVDLLALPLILAGHKAGFVVIYHDITQRKWFEQELRAQLEYFEALFVNTPVAVMTVDLDAKVVSWNPMAEKLFGYAAEEAVGRDIDDLVARDAVIREEAQRYTQQLMAEGRVRATTRRTRKDGSLVDVELFAVPVTVAGKRLGYIGIFHDIGELQRSRRDAEAANQAKSVFLANMSHELRTPLNAILGFTQLLADDPNLNAEQQANLAIINRSGEHLLALINDVLEVSKIEAGRAPLKESGFDLYELLDSLEEMFRLRAEDKGLAMRCERGDGVPRSVAADQGKLRQVLSNLLGNAVKFTAAGSVTLRVSALSGGAPAESGRAKLRFAVEDTGPGIAPEELELIFQPFVQTTSGQQSHEGTGLGLSICRSSVRLMGGDIAVRSQVGQGSTFEFEVQVGLGQRGPEPAERPRRRVLGMAPGQPRHRLLVAEDSETNRRLMLKMLEGFPFEVQAAADGRQALELWERWQPHLIWMDMRMPVVDGHEVTRRIRAAEVERRTVIIALTASAFEEDREKMLAEGCDDVVRKPFRKEEILNALASHLGVRFVYADEAHAAEAAPAAESLAAEALAGLRREWLAGLRKATVEADLNRILELAEGIRAERPALAGALEGLAREFDYKPILAWIRSGEGGHGA